MAFPTLYLPHRTGGAHLGPAPLPETSAPCHSGHLDSFPILAAQQVGFTPAPSCPLSSTQEQRLIGLPSLPGSLVARQGQQYRLAGDGLLPVQPPLEIWGLLASDLKTPFPQPQHPGFCPNTQTQSRTPYVMQSPSRLHCQQLDLIEILDFTPALQRGAGGH